MKRCFFNWSGGKDSSLCLYQVLNDPDLQVELMVTTLSEKFRRVSMHGVREELLDAQANSIGIPLQKVWLPEMPDMNSYDHQMKQVMSEIKQSGIDHAIFGDIFLEDLKKYREQKLDEVGIDGLFPLWKRNTKELILEFIKLGFKAVLVCVDERSLDKSFAGRLIDQKLINELPDSVDPCGENGEYHSFVFDGPIFKRPIPYQLGEIVYRQYKDPTSGGKQQTGFWYQDLVLT